MCILYDHSCNTFFLKNFLQLINDYLRDNYWARVGINNRDVQGLNTAACRLMLDILPGLETSAVFQPDMEGLIHRLFSWAEKSAEPLQSYATGLLAAAMEVQDIATGFREQNGKMVPLMLKRLHELQQKAAEERQQYNASRPFAHFGQNRFNNSLPSAEHKTFPGKRKVKDKNLQENGVTENLMELAGYSSPEEEVADSENICDKPTPPLKKRKSDLENEQMTPVKNNTAYPLIMSPPLSVPPLAPKNFANNSQVFFSYILFRLFLTIYLFCFLICKFLIFSEHNSFKKS